MRFLVDANMPRSTGPLLRELGHESVDVRDIGLGTGPDGPIAEYARVQGLCIVTRDFDFGDIRVYQPRNYHGIVVLDLPVTATAPIVLRRLETFIKGCKQTLEGRLAIVDSSRVRWRPTS